jgi:uncharacterized protein involved in exopolysaccharide biosynthesis
MNPGMTCAPPPSSTPLTGPDPQPPYLQICTRLVLVAGTVFLLTVLAGFFIIDNVVSKTYTATAMIKLPPSVADTGLEPADFDPSSFVSVDVLRSSEVLLPVIQSLDLKKAWAQRVFKSKEGQLSDADALAYMNKILKLDAVRGTNIIDIRVSSDVPKEAADIANEIAKRYKSLSDQDEKDRFLRGEAVLRDQIVQQQKAVDATKARMAAASPTQAATTPDSQSDLDQKQSVLNTLALRLKQIDASKNLQQSPVRIVSLAEVPTRPDGSYGLLVILAAGLLSVAAASFVEVVFMLTRASNRP